MRTLSKDFLLESKVKKFGFECKLDSSNAMCFRSVVPHNVMVSPQADSRVRIHSADRQFCFENLSIKFH